jgi:hypothetical protein
MADQGHLPLNSDSNHADYFIGDHKGVGVKIGVRKETRTRPADSRQAPQGGDWQSRAAAWQLTPSALIPFGSFVPPRASRRAASGSERR